MDTNRKPLIGMSLDELREVVIDGGMPRFVAGQLAKWIYEHRVTEYDRMTGLSKKNRSWLEAHYTIGRPAPAAVSKSADGTIKYAFNVGDGHLVESVSIPDHDRLTLCVSSQAGCRMNCYFCATGRMGFKKHLTAAQIMAQILGVPPGDGRTPLTNIVFMGMGEPLDNLSAVMKSIEILTSPWGWNWSPKRITVSTVGKLPELKELLDKTSVHIAISVHTADMEERSALMPAQRAFPLQSVISLLRGYDFSHQRRLSLEYIMWRNVNDDLAHADKLAKLIAGVDCRVNLIRFHAIPGVELHPSSEEKMIIFRNYLNSKGIISTIRASRGEDIEAACGMLATRNGKKNINDKINT